MCFYLNYVISNVKISVKVIIPFLRFAFTGQYMDQADPFAKPPTSIASDPYAKPVLDAYGKPVATVDPYTKQNSDPYAKSNDPYTPNSQVIDPYAKQSNDPYAKQPIDPYAPKAQVLDQYGNSIDSYTEDVDPFAKRTDNYSSGKIDHSPDDLTKCQKHPLFWGDSKIIMRNNIK